jgi:hypothetical protein
METRISVSESEILEALRAALTSNADDGGALTTEELRQKLGISVLRCRKLIWEQIRAGRMENVQVNRPFLGRPGGGLVPGYRWVG